MLVEDPQRDELDLDDGGMIQTQHPSGERKGQQPDIK